MCVGEGRRGREGRGENSSLIPSPQTPGARLWANLPRASSRISRVHPCASVSSLDVGRIASPLLSAPFLGLCLARVKRDEAGPNLGIINLSHCSWEQNVYLSSDHPTCPSAGSLTGVVPVGVHPGFIWRPFEPGITLVLHPEVLGSSKPLSLPDSVLSPGTFLLMWARSEFQPRSHSSSARASLATAVSCPPQLSPPPDVYFWAADAQKVGDRAQRTFLSRSLLA